MHSAFLLEGTVALLFLSRKVAVAISSSVGIELSTGARGTSIGVGSLWGRGRAKRLEIIAYFRQVFPIWFFGATAIIFPPIPDVHTGVANVTLGHEGLQFCPTSSVRLLQPAFRLAL